LRIALIGGGLADEATLSGAFDGIGDLLARHYEMLVASSVAAAAFGELLTDFRQSGGRLVVAVPPSTAMPPVEASHAAEVHPASTREEYLEALLDGTEALLCCPGDIATFHELHHFLDAGLRVAALDRVRVYLYDRDKYFAPWRLQLQVLIEAGGAPAELDHAIRPFESARGLRDLLPL
jgi:hypothetical protein